MQFERVGNGYKVVKFETQVSGYHLHDNWTQSDVHCGEIIIPSEHNGKPVISIGEWAFSSCRDDLIRVVIPSTVTSIDSHAFSGCTGLVGIVIPNGVTSVGEKAFNDCTKLICIAIPSSVTSIGDQAFSGCTSLESITVDPYNTKYASQDGILYDKNATTLIHIPNAIAGAVTIPYGVRSIEDGAFSGCDGLTRITIPDSVTKIGASAFLHCTGLNSIVYNGTKKQWDAIQKGGSWIDLGGRDLTVSCTDVDTSVAQWNVPKGAANKSLLRKMIKLSIFWIPVAYFLIALILNLFVKEWGLLEIKNEMLRAILLCELPIDENSDIIQIVEPIVGIAMLVYVVAYYFAVLRNIRQDHIWKQTVKRTEAKESYVYKSTTTDEKGRKVDEYEYVRTSGFKLFFMALGLTLVFPIYAIWRVKKNPA